MKNLIFSIVLILSMGVIAVIHSCDKIDPPYAEITDVSDCPVPAFPEVTTPEKTLLIEEFTGHECVYCPTGAFNLHLIQQEPYGQRVVLMAIHSGDLAVPEPPEFPLDLRAMGEIGETLYDDFLNPGQPAAMFNRYKIDGTNFTYNAPDTWKTKAETVLAQTPVITLQIINDYDDVSKKLCTHIRTKFLTANNQTLKIAIFITEDSIIGNQKNNNAAVGTVPIIQNYKFMDVLRYGFKGANGEALTAGNVVQDSAMIRTYKKVLEPSWVPKHCKVVAYVYDANTKAILQVCEKHVIE